MSELICPECEYICDDAMHLCPKCRFALDDKNIKTAQAYGGVGGTPSNYAPGSSPLGNRGIGGGGSALWGAEDGLDAIMGRTRHDIPDDNEELERNFETRLQPFHDYVEEDLPPYYLTFKERQEWKDKKNKQRRRKSYEEGLKSIIENSPTYINLNFPPKPEHIAPMDFSLSIKRKYDEIPERDSVTKDKVVYIDPDGNERIASNRLATPKTFHGRNTIFGPHSDDEDPSDPLGAELNQFKALPGWVNQTPLYENQFDLEENLGKEGQQFIDWSNENGKNLMDYYSEHIDIPEKEEALPSPVSGSEVALTGNIEKQLEKLKKQRSPGRLPNDPYVDFRLDQIFNEGKEPVGIFDRYSGGDDLTGGTLGNLPRL